MSATDYLQLLACSAFGTWLGMRIERRRWMAAFKREKELLAELDPWRKMRDEARALNEHLRKPR